MHTMWIVFLFALGACVGSFLNVVIWRLPRGESIVFPPSHCPSCGKQIRWYDNVPILSWLLLRARCRFCGVRISPRYIFIEALTAVLVSALYVCYYVLRVRRGLLPFEQSWPTFAAHAALLCGLLAASMVDIDLFIVPLPVMWVCAGIGILAAAVRPTAALPSVSPATAAAAVGAMIGLAIAKVLLHYGLIQESFLDADEGPLPPAGRSGRMEAEARTSKTASHPSAGRGPSAKPPMPPRARTLRELLYLVPTVVLVAAVYWLISRSQAFGEALGPGRYETNPAPLAGKLVPLLAALAAALAGAAWTTGVRLVFERRYGKEPPTPPICVAITSQHGVNPRLEILREVVFLAPAMVLAVAGYWLVEGVGPVRTAMDSWLGGDTTAARHAGSAAAAVWGMVVGIALIWGIRILGTLGFGKEAMGLGDVHILAAIGATAGWKVAALTFLTAPFLGVAYAIHGVAAGRQRREIPFGPWLATATLLVLLYYDKIVAFLVPTA